MIFILMRIQQVIAATRINGNFPMRGESEIHSYKKLQACDAKNDAPVLDKLKFSLLACHQFFCGKHRPAINISYATAVMWVTLAMLVIVVMLAWRPFMRNRRPPH